MKATNKDKAQKMISAKIAEKLVELANKYVVPCININIPGRYSASQLDDEKDAYGRKLCYGFDKDKCAQIMPADNEFCVSVNANDFTAEEMEILGYEPKFRLQIKPDNIFYAISKFEQLAGLRSTDRAKFIIGEPKTLYETERAKVVLFDYTKQKIATKTKTLTIISDSLAIYLLKKANYAFCLKINGKWIDVYHRAEYYDLAETIERAKKIITYESTKSGAQKYIAEHNNAYADYCRLILSELEAMEQSSEAETANNAEPSAETSCTEASNAEAVENCNANGDSKANTETADSTGNDTAELAETSEQSTASNAKKDSPPKDSGTPINQCGRKSAVLSDFRGKGDKVYHPSDKNRNMGIYCGKNGFLPAEVRDSPQSASINKYT